MLTLSDVIVSFWMAPVVLFIVIPLLMLVCSWIVVLMKKNTVGPDMSAVSDKDTKETVHRSMQATAAS